MRARACWEGYVVRVGLCLWCTARVSIGSICCARCPKLWDALMQRAQARSARHGLTERGIRRCTANAYVPIAAAPRDAGGMKAT